MVEDYKTDSIVGGYIGKRFDLNDYNKEEYMEVAKWCNATQKGLMQRTGDIVECVPLPQPTVKERALQNIERDKFALSELDYKTIRFAERVFKEMDVSRFPDLQKEKDGLMALWQEREELRASINQLELIN